MKNLVASVAVLPPGKRWEAEVKAFLPEDVVVDIVSRLPSKDVFRYKCVCRRWRDLISSKDFVDLHIQRGLRCAVPMVLVEDWKKKRQDQIFLDKWWLPGRKKPVIHRFGDSYTDCSTTLSLEGFLFSTFDSKEIIITNPVYAEKVRIILPIRFCWSTQVCGMFFNQTLREYCLLLAMKDNLLIEYRIINLGPKPCVRQISNSWNRKSKFPFARPVVVGEHLYWLVTPEEDYEFSDYADIMEFDTKTEGFILLPYPGMKTGKNDLFGLDLLNIDGFLSVVRIARLHMEVDVTIWILRDRGKESWTSSSYCFSCGVYPWYDTFKALAYKDRELIIQSGERLLVCNLSMRTVRNFGKKKYNKYVSCFSHIISLASLRNCKSMICMEGLDEENEKLEV